MITVTYLSPRRVCRHTCSSTPIDRARRRTGAGSSISTRLPSARTASLAVFHATPSPSATRATVRCWTHDPFQRPPQPAARQLRPRLGRAAGVLAPHVPAAGAAVAADRDQQRRRPPARAARAPAAGSRCRAGCPRSRSAGTTDRARRPGRPGPHGPVRAAGR